MLENPESEKREPKGKLERDCRIGKSRRASEGEQGLKGPKREKEGKGEGGSHEQGGGSWEERGGRDRGTRAVGAGSAAAAAASAARRLARSLAHWLVEPAARLSAARSSGSWPGALARLGLWKTGPRDWPAQPGAAAEAGRWRSRDCEDAEPGRAGGTRRRWLGAAVPGRWLWSLATNFPPAPRISAALLGAEAEFGAGRAGGENAGAWEKAGGSRQDAGRPAWAGAGPPAAVGTQRPWRGRPERSGAARWSGEGIPSPLGVSGLPPPEPPRAAPGAPTARSASGALPARVAARSLRGAARFPSRARGAPLRRQAPARACALLRFAGAKCNVRSFHSFSSRGPDSLRGGLGREQPCGSTSWTSLPPSAGTPAPEVEREARHSQRAPGARSRSSQLLAQPQAVVLEVG